MGGDIVAEAVVGVSQMRQDVCLLGPVSQLTKHCESFVAVFQRSGVVAKMLMCDRQAIKGDGLAAEVSEPSESRQGVLGAGQRLPVISELDVVPADVVERASLAILVICHAEQV